MTIRTNEKLTKADIRKLIRQHYAHLEAVADKPFTPETNDIDEEFAEQRAIVEERLFDLNARIESQQINAHFAPFARQTMIACGVDPGLLGEDRWNEYVEGLARAHREQLRLFLYRLDDAITEYVPADPLFVDRPKLLQQPVGLTIGELIEEHLRDRGPVLTPKTLKTHLSKLRLLEQFLGADAVAETVTRNDLRPFPEGLLKLRRNRHLSPGKTFQANLTNSETGRIGPKTAENIWAQCAALFRWAFKKGFISTNCNVWGDTETVSYIISSGEGQDDRYPQIATPHTRRHGAVHHPSLPCAGLHRVPGQHPQHLLGR